MATNWPPPQGTYPAWPPAEFNTDRFDCADWQSLADALQEFGFTHDQPTQSERNLFFPNSVRCGDGHQVNGRMVISPDGLRRWPFAACNNVADRELLVLWPPYTCGWRSAPTSF